MPPPGGCFFAGYAEYILMSDSNMRDIKTKLTKSKSRTQNTIYNFVTSIGGQILTILVQFAVRTVFIRTLGKSYLGINGLFSNILTMLSLAELGVGSAILFKLYDPLAKGDHHRITLLMRLYKNIYRVIGLVIFTVGVALIPLLPVLIRDYANLAKLHISAEIVFILYLIKSVSSYLFFAYKSAIIKADQKQYLINITSYLFTIILGILQIVSLLLTRNFHVYILIDVAIIILQNIVIARFADQLYPYINDKTDDAISKQEIKGLFKDCAAIMLYNINSVVVKATDNIVLSMFLGLGAVGLYSNYYIFYTSIRSVFTKIFNSVSHSIGNLHAADQPEHEYEVFESVILISAILGGVAFAGIFAVADEFVETWIGKEWVIAQPLAFLMGLELYTTAFRMSISKFRSSMGLFQQAKYRPVAGMLINIVVSVALVNVWGICGVLVGTIASDWLTFMWYDPLILHKYGFKNGASVKRYYGKFLKYVLVVLLTGTADFLICRHFLCGFGWFSVAVHALICAVTVPGAILLVSWKTPEGQYVFRLGRRELSRITKRLTR